MKNILYKADLLFFSITFSVNVFAQSDSKNIDSLKKVLATEKEDTNKVNTLRELSWESSDSTNTLQYVNKSLAIDEKLNFKRGQSLAYMRKAWIGDNHEEELHFSNIAISFAKESNDTLLICWGYVNYANFCKDFERYTEAMQSYMEALKIASW